MDEEIDPQEIIPDHQDSPTEDPLGSNSSIGVDHPSMSDYLEFMKDVPRRSVEGGMDQKASFPAVEGNGPLVSAPSDARSKIESPAGDGGDPASTSVGSYSQGFGASIYRPAMSNPDTTQAGLSVPRYSTRSSVSYPQYDNWSSPFNPDGGGMTLNSSGEENKMGSPEEFARLPDGAGSSSVEYFNGDSPSFRPVSHQLGSIIGPLDSIGCMPVCPGRETHNEKERKRRYRIKNACSLLKDLVPGLSDKTDKATVLEYTVQYLIHLKKHVGRQFDKDFMEKYSPY